jgi:hypothetical protein
MDRTPAAALPIAALPPTPAITRRPQEHTEQPTENTANDSARPVGLGPSGPGATPNAGFAELFAAGARSADGKKGVSVPGAQFDPNLARNALAGVAAEVAACKEKDGPSGAATVVVSFDTSGRVSSSSVSGTPFEGTATGACIAAAMKRVTIPPFSGAPGSVSKTVVIQ